MSKIKDTCFQGSDSLTSLVNIYFRNSFPSSSVHLQYKTVGSYEHKPKSFVSYFLSTFATGDFIKKVLLATWALGDR